MVKAYMFQSKLLIAISLLALQCCTSVYASDKSIFADPPQDSTVPASQGWSEPAKAVDPEAVKKEIEFSKTAVDAKATDEIQLKPALSKPVYDSSSTTTTTTTSTESVAKPYVKMAPEPVVRSTKSTSKTVQTTTSSSSSASNEEIDKAVQSILNNKDNDYVRIRKDRKSAKRMAKYHWLDKAAAANPQIIEAITQHRCAAYVLAKHPRLAAISDADHYLCRRLTKWKCVARRLAKQGQVWRVIDHDPEGIYQAIRRDRKISRILAKNPTFDQMIVDNPDLGRELAKHM